MSGYKYSSTNICDFITYANGNLFLIECKSHTGKSFPLSLLTQLDKLSQYTDLEGVNPYLILWLIDCKLVCAVNISDVKQMISDGKKSINEKDIQSGLYNIINIPAKIPKVYPQCDYSILIK